MSIKEFLEFLFEELKKALGRNDVARISDIAATAEMLFEFSERQNDEVAISVLKDFDYIVLHYDEEPQYVGNYLEKIKSELETWA